MKSSNISKNKIVLFIVVLVLLLFIRTVGFDSPLYDDEIDHVQGIYDQQDYWLNSQTSHPPMISWIYVLFSSIFGLDIWKYRALIFLFGIISIVLTYLLSKLIYDNQKVALVSSTIVAVSFYHFVSSLQVGAELILTCFYLLFFILYVHYKKSRSNYLLVSLGIVFGLALLIKLNAVLMLVVVGIFELIDIIKKKNWRLVVEKVKIFSPILIIGLALFSIFPILNHLASSGVASQAVGNISRRLTIGFSLMGFSMFMFWSTPFLVGLFSLGAISDYKDKNNKIPLIWFFTTFLFYLFFTTKGDFSTYFVNTIIPMAMVGGYFISKIKWKATHWLFGSFVFIISYLFFDKLNKSIVEYVPRLMEFYVPRLLSLDWGFLFPFTSSSGPLFLFSFKAIIVAFLISSIIIILFFVFKSKNTKKYLLIIFIGISFSFNVLLVQEFLFHKNHPDPGEAITDAVDYYYNNFELIEKPIYTNNNGLLFHLDNYFKIDKEKEYSIQNNYYTGVYGENVQRLTPIRSAREGTIFLLDHTYIPRDSDLWLWSNECNLIKEFKSKGKTFVYVFEC